MRERPEQGGHPSTVQGTKVEARVEAPPAPQGPGPARGRGALPHCPELPVRPSPGPEGRGRCTEQEAEAGALRGHRWGGGAGTQGWPSGAPQAEVTCAAAGGSRRGHEELLTRPPRPGAEGRPLAAGAMAAHPLQRGPGGAGPPGALRSGEPHGGSLGPATWGFTREGRVS